MRRTLGSMDAIVGTLDSRTDEMVTALGRLVSIESPSADPQAVRACIDEADALARELTGIEAVLHDVDGRAHARWTFGTPRVLLVGHLDTVWPVGTLERMPFTVIDGVVRGPGCFDMKAGVVQGLFAVAALDDPDGVEILLTSDEELGSPTSRGLIEERARQVEAVLVLEPSADGALKTARKGVSMYTLHADGRAAHAGLEPHHGVNALVELAHQVLALERIARADADTTVTPTVAAAGTTTNTVPAEASAHVDARCLSRVEQERVDAEIRALRPVLPGASLRVEGGPNRPPFPPSASRELFARARQVAARLGLASPDGVVVGGGSDGNFTAGAGVPTLDGLGPVGGGAHAVDEHVIVEAMPQRAALVAGLVADLLDNPIARRGERI